MVTRFKSGNFKKKSYLAQKHNEPHTYLQASKHPPWVDAMQNEYNALMRNNTWTLVSPPADTRIFGCHWVYKTKYKQDGSLDSSRPILWLKVLLKHLGLIILIPSA